MNIFSLLANGMLIAATISLVVSLMLVRRLIANFQHESLRSKWNLLSLLILAFIISYLVYLLLFWQTYHNMHDLIVPAVFFFGACFVWLTSRLALQTTEDVSRIVLLEQENITDPLIGIYNRRYLDRRLEDETNRALRYKLPLSILMIDIDHFKRINDTHGHQIGDQALIFLGKILMDEVRNLDVVARFGGEEFAIIAPETPTLTATELAKRLHQHIGTHPLIITRHSGEKLEIKMTVSIGIASLGYDNDNMQKLLKSADQALYQAKQNGRNQVVLSELNIGE
jgi:diguanylate cyclase (GGDEF)-like protein